MRILLAFIPVILLFLMYVFIENTMLIVRQYKVRIGMPKGKSIRAVQISDLHKKKFHGGYAPIINKVQRLRPDVIFVTGDLVSRTETSFEKKAALLKVLNSICPVICIKGNHELDLRSEVMDRLRQGIISSGAMLLENTAVSFKKNGAVLNIYGADLKRSVYRNEKNGFSNLEKYTAKELFGIFGQPKKISVLLAHDPLFFDEYAKWGADICFCGHMHGGIIGTPFGGMLSPERKFFPKYCKGVFNKNGKRMVVSAGIGKFRVFDPSEIVLVELV